MTIETFQPTVLKHWSYETDTARYRRDDGMLVCRDVLTVFPDLTFEKIDEMYPVGGFGRRYLVVSCLDYDKPDGPNAIMRLLTQDYPVRTEYRKGKYGCYVVRSN